MAVLLLNLILRGSLGFGGALGLPLLALVIPVKVLAPAWSLVGIMSSAAIVGHSRKHVAKREFLGLLVGDRIHSGLSQAAFQRVVCAALFLCGVPLLLR